MKNLQESAAIVSDELMHRLSGGVDEQQMLHKLAEMLSEEELTAVVRTGPPLSRTALAALSYKRARKEYR